jgi:hypothetical protein
MTTFSRRQFFLQSTPLGAVLGIAVFGIFLALAPLTSHANPVITSVSPIDTNEVQTITIDGSGFGTLNNNGLGISISTYPYTGDTAYLRLTEITPSGHLNLGWSDGSSVDSITAIIDSWTDSQIVLGGFAGNWNGATWYNLVAGDTIYVDLWNTSDTVNSAAYYASEYDFAMKVTPTPTPEPSSILLAGTGIFLLALVVMRKQLAVFSQL